MWNKLRHRYDAWKFRRKVKKAGGWKNLVETSFKDAEPPIVALIDVANKDQANKIHNWTTKPWYPFDKPIKPKDNNNVTN